MGMPDGIIASFAQHVASFGVSTEELREGMPLRGSRNACLRATSTYAQAAHKHETTQRGYSRRWSRFPSERTNRGWSPENGACRIKAVLGRTGISAPSSPLHGTLLGARFRRPNVPHVV